ncbi:MAG TPA: bifunctional pyr operon transcriptional regulator/uracil phosphoribosyltransferase PyrR [bacterium]|nr:bifunctional pyr operon transcriptional regulator/uracil phosphoribosyltransferase PyrR [bacterium]
MKRKGLKVTKVVMNAEEMEKTLNRMVHEIIERVGAKPHVAIVGIRTRGVHIAERILDKIERAEKVKVASGTIDIALYRDDFFKGLASPEVGPSNLNFDVDGANIVLVDDVLYTGRTVRAAIDALMDYGRPASIMYAALVDRGHRELPIQPDFIGKTVQTTRDEAVAVLLKEVDDEDKVVVGER